MNDTFGIEREFGRPFRTLFTVWHSDPGLRFDRQCGLRFTWGCHGAHRWG